MPNSGPSLFLSPRELSPVAELFDLDLPRPKGSFPETINCLESNCECARSHRTSLWQVQLRLESAAAEECMPRNKYR
jgi:hypothetical protein